MVEMDYDGQKYNVVEGLDFVIPAKNDGYMASQIPVLGAVVLVADYGTSSGAWNWRCIWCKGLAR